MILNINGPLTVAKSQCIVRPLINTCTREKRQCEPFNNKLELLNKTAILNVMFVASLYACNRRHIFQFKKSVSLPGKD